MVIHNQEKNCRSHLIIQDEGKGMDKETLENLFTQDLKSTFGNQGEKKDCLRWKH